MKDSTRDDLQMMQSPEQWPMVTYLPIKHRITSITGRVTIELAALMFDDSSAGTVFYFRAGNVHSSTSNQTTRIGDSSKLSSLTDAGWIVD